MNNKDLLYTNALFICALCFSIVDTCFAIDIFPKINYAWGVITILSVFLCIILWKNSRDCRLYYAQSILLYSLFSMIVTSSYDYNFIHTLLCNKYFILPYFVVLLSIVSYDITIVKKIMKISIVAGLLFLFILYKFQHLLVFQNSFQQNVDLQEQGFSLDSIVKPFCLCSMFFLFLMPYIKKRISLFFLAIILISFIYSIFFARRNMILTILFALILGLLTILKYRRNIVIWKYLIIVVLLILLPKVIDFIGLLSIGAIDNSFFDAISYKFDTNTRETEVAYFIKSMNESPFYWIFGKGISSTYYTPSLGTRYLIESGYLHIIMKIGIVGLITICILLYKAIKNTINGNILMVACRYFIFVCVVESLYAGVPTFQLQWCILWVCVGMCFSPQIINLTNEEIIEYLNS